MSNTTQELEKKDVIEEIYSKINPLDDKKYQMDKETYNRIKQAERQEKLKNTKNLFIGFITGTLCGIGSMVGVYIFSIEPNILSKHEFEVNQIKLLNTQHAKAMKEIKALFYDELQEVDERIDKKELQEKIKPKDTK